ncbi:putative nuclease HARBI1 [Saccostrea cucullata]|uniref:putative nuclease HARBI1 n=1 Tax=Saccostrea cuccullata TaxID=36930 RepID=UPI002ED54712
MAARRVLVWRYRNAQQHRRPRFFRDRSNPLEDLDEDEVFERYRFRPQTILFILGLLPNLARPTGRNNPLPPLLQLLLCLRFLATGAIHLLIGDSLNISRSTAGRCIRDIASHLSNLCRRFVRFPTGNDALSVKRAFSAIAGFPNVLGCLDGTQIRIRKPKLNEADYVNRKGYHSLNVQMCCDHTFRITSCVASWPGSVHDSRVFRQSALCAQFENGEIPPFFH